MGYSIKLEHFQLIINTGIGEFIRQAGLDIDEVIQLFLQVTGVFIFSYIVIYLILKYTKKFSKIIYTIPILLIIVCDTLIGGYKISKDLNTVFNNTYYEAIIFRPNISKYILDQKISFKLKNKAQLDTTVYCKKTDKTPPHIVIFMAESLRADMTAKEIMPNLNNLKGKLFKNHYSTSNATFFSIFSVFYGLFPTYYHDTIKKSKPTILNILDSLNYHKTIYNTLSLKYGGVNHFLKDEYFDKHYERIGKSRTTLHIEDKKIINDFKNSFNKSGQPEFHLLLTNSTHHDYYFPREKKFEKFNPYPKKHIQLLKTDKKLYQTLVFNKYKNAIYYLDSLILETVETIKKSSQWNNTIFIFFGDHGEEFFEDGHLLHASSLNYYQTSAALFIHSPQSKRKEKVFKTTSHIDILPTIIFLLKKDKVDIKKPFWIKGKDIFSNLYSDRAVFSQQISTTRKIKISMANKKIVFIPTRKEKDSRKKSLINKYIIDLQKY